MSYNYRKKPVTIQAVQWTGNNYEEISAFMGRTPEVANNLALVVPTTEGDLYATKYDWIVKGIKGEFYPCKPDVFDATYESVP